MKYGKYVLFLSRKYKTVSYIQKLFTSLKITGTTLYGQNIKPGDLFIALSGKFMHGINYISYIKNLSKCIVLTDNAGIEKFNEILMPILVHKDPRLIISQIAADIYSKPSESLIVIGITGTSGKTTTVYLIEAGLRSVGRITGLIGTTEIKIGRRNLTSHLTTPEAPDLQYLLAVMIANGVDTVVMEVSSHALELNRVNNVKFALVGFTNLSYDHLDFHLTMDKYFKTKARLFKSISVNCANIKVVCVDDKAGALIAILAEKTVTISANNRIADWQINKVFPARSRSQKFSIINSSGFCYEFIVEIPGYISTINKMLAFTILGCIGLIPEESSLSLHNLKVSGRLQSIKYEQSFLVIVDYAHKPSALQAILKTLTVYKNSYSLKFSRILIVIGSGGNRYANKRISMGKIAVSMADLIIITDDNPRNEDPETVRSELILGTATALHTKTRVIEIANRYNAINEVISYAFPEDIILIAGKGHEDNQIIFRQNRYFNDQYELEVALNEQKLKHLI